MTGITGSPIALQLYTVRDETAQDFPQTLRYIAAMGYTAVEFAGYGNLPSKDMAALLADIGLYAASTHVRLDALEQDIEYQLNYCLDIGCTNLILPWLPPEQRTPEAFQRLAPRLNEFGRRCSERGITFGYHNHNFEFEQYNDSYLLDLLLASTDPTLVSLEFDVYWAAYAEVDPIAYLRRHKGRIPIVHLKDMAPDSSFTEIGDGTLNMGAIYLAAKDNGTRWFVVENDKPRIPSLESARRSLLNLQSIMA